MSKMYPHVADTSPQAQRVISLNVGGTVFTTSLQTLKSDPESILAGMFSGAGLVNSAIDPEGRFFIDRDPKHFALILNYLRDGECDLPTDPRERKELLREAEHYEIQGLEDMLGSFQGAAVDGVPAEPSAGVPHAAQTYTRIISRARNEAGPGNIARAEAALFALMFGKNLAEPVSPFEAEVSKKAASTAGGSSRHRHSSTYDKDGSLVHLGRKCLWLRAKDSSDPHPLDGAEELGAHCHGAALGAFVKQYYSVIQYDFMKRGYLCHAEGVDGYERLYLEIPTGAAASAEVSGTMFEGLVQSLLECTLGGEGRRDIRGLMTRKTRHK